MNRLEFIEKFSEIVHIAGMSGEIPYIIPDKIPVAENNSILKSDLFYVWGTGKLKVELSTGIQYLNIRFSEMVPMNVKTIFREGSTVNRLVRCNYIHGKGNEVVEVMLWDCEYKSISDALKKSPGFGISAKDAANISEGIIRSLAK